MMKTFYKIFSAILLLVVSGCQNNGDIGRMFGTWRVDSYTVNGDAVTEIKLNDETSVPLSHVTFSFQNSIVNVVTVLDNYQNSYSQFGSWSEEGDTFTLDFTHVDAENPDGGGRYSAPTWLGMVSSQKMVMKISDSRKDSFTLTWNDPQGNLRVYKMHKTW